MKVENKKRQLEDDVDTLQDEVTKLKAVSDMHHTASKELEAKEAELQSSLTSQMAQHRESHQKQVRTGVDSMRQIHVWNEKFLPRNNRRLAYIFSDPAIDYRTMDD